MNAYHRFAVKWDYVACPCGICRWAGSVHDIELDPKCQLTCSILAASANVSFQTIMRTIKPSSLSLDIGHTICICCGRVNYWLAGITKLSWISACQRCKWIYINFLPHALWAMQQVIGRDIAGVIVSAV